MLLEPQRHEEIRRLIEDCYGEAVETLRCNRERLDRVAHTLPGRETLNEDEAYTAAGVTREAVPAGVASGETDGSGRAGAAPRSLPRRRADRDRSRWR